MSIRWADCAQRPDDAPSARFGAIRHCLGSGNAASACEGGCIGDRCGFVPNIERGHPFIMLLADAIIDTQAALLVACIGIAIIVNINVVLVMASAHRTDIARGIKRDFYARLVLLQRDAG